MSSMQKMNSVAFYFSNVTPQKALQACGGCSEKDLGILGVLDLLGLLYIFWTFSDAFLDFSDWFERPDTHSPLDDDAKSEKANKQVHIQAIRNVVTF